MTESEDPESRQSIAWTDPKILLTAGLTLLLLLHIFNDNVHVDSNALILIAFIFALWLAPLIEELQISEYLRLKLRAAKTDLELTKLAAISRLSQRSLRVLIPDYEFEVLDKLANNPNYERDTDQDMVLYYKDLFHLLELGLIERVDPNIRIPSNKGKLKVRDYYQVTPLGTEYIQLRKSASDGRGTGVCEPDDARESPS